MRETKSGSIAAMQNEVLRALQGIRFGSVEVIVHDSKIVQIVRKEKLRPDAGASNSPNDAHKD